MIIAWLLLIVLDVSLLVIYLLVFLLLRVYGKQAPTDSHIQEVSIGRPSLGKGPYIIGN